MGDLDHDGDHLTCSRWESWPPIEIIQYEDPQQVRAELGNAAYHRVRVWQQACGLMKMDAQKCPTCPYVEVNGVLAKAPGGGFHLPRTTQATRMAQLRKKKDGK